MQVRHGFPAVPAMVEHEPITVFSQTQRRSDVSGFQEQVAEQGLVARLGGADASNRFLGHQQDVHGRLRIDVMKRQDEVVFVGDLRRNLAGGDFLEKRHGPSVPA